MNSNEEAKNAKEGGQSIKGEKSCIHRSEGEYVCFYVAGT